MRSLVTAFEDWNMRLLSRCTMSDAGAHYIYNIYILYICIIYMYTHAHAYTHIHIAGSANTGARQSQILEAEFREQDYQDQESKY